MWGSFKWSSYKCFGFVDLVGFILRYNRSNSWRRDEIDIIEGMVDTFRTTFIEVFGTFHSTGMRTLKFHLLSHLAEDVKKFGGLHNINAGVYEHAYLRFKDAYRRTSKRRNTAIEETIRRLETSEIIRKASERVLGSSAVICKGATKNDGRCFICTRWRKIS